MFPINWNEPIKTTPHFSLLDSLKVQILPWLLGLTRTCKLKGEVLNCGLLGKGNFCMI